MERLATLAEENNGLRGTLEAAECLVRHRQTLDEVIGQALEGALGVVGGVEAAEEEKEKAEQELEELKAQREELREVVKQDGQVVAVHLEQMVCSLEGAMDLLSNAWDLGREFEAHVLSLVERLDGMVLAPRGEDGMVRPSVEYEGMLEPETSVGGRPDEAIEVSSRMGEEAVDAYVYEGDGLRGDVETELVRDEGAESMSVEDQGELVAEPVMVGDVSEGSQGTVGAVLEGLTEEESPRGASLHGGPAQAEGIAEVSELVPGSSFVVGGESEADEPSVEVEEEEQPAPEARGSGPWWMGMARRS
jgi:hypothetical protein